MYKTSDKNYMKMQLYALSQRGLISIWKYVNIVWWPNSLLLRSKFANYMINQQKLLYFVIRYFYSGEEAKYTTSDVFHLMYVKTSVLYLQTVYKDELNKKPIKIDFAIIQQKKNLYAISFYGKSIPICFALSLIHHADFRCAMSWGVFPATRRIHPFQINSQDFDGI